MPLSINEQAPDFSLPTSDGQIFSLSAIKGKPCILYFYPKDFSRVCSAEACEFRDNFAELRGLDVAVYGISRDDVATHARFRKAHQLPFELLADTDGKVAEAYKALVPIIKLTRRITYLLDSEHKIVAVYENMFNARNHIQRMLTKMQH
ncbi:peroxiredoxin Q/BCP [Flexibacter flexilis DSM 6793]|uniref:thioredoxin-dependent peroxiredoxin n=1 Tax=Flexibacter flexilis DSM 6793 TaxID=927664 RepID=A0A1I1FLH1_9BACT|nr:peroxiredoxin [Flexibacter flexilis]SFC00369.1 peroxiredoxin Q/BCP [Flexibacter flexilis DSM 6793]